MYGYLPDVNRERLPDLRVSITHLRQKTQIANGGLKNFFTAACSRHTSRDSAIVPNGPNFGGAHTYPFTEPKEQISDLPNQRML